MADIQHYLDQLPFEVCPHCQALGGLKPHDIVYKLNDEGLIPVGRRVFCSNRYQHSGCGRTFRLYLSDIIPRLRYTGVQLMLFILFLLQQKPIAIAYLKATGKTQSRHAYRWLNKLHHQCAAFRCSLSVRASIPHPFIYRSRRLTILLTTLLTMSCQMGIHVCACYQSQRQHRFI